MFLSYNGWVGVYSCSKNILKYCYWPSLEQESIFFRHWFIVLFKLMIIIRFCLILPSYQNRPRPTFKKNISTVIVSVFLTYKKATLFSTLFSKYTVSIFMIIHTQLFTFYSLLFHLALEIILFFTVTVFFQSRSKKKL